MDNYRQENEQNEKRELFKRAISEAMELKMRKIEEEIKDIELPPISKQHKTNMNRLFRECVGAAFIPFPEAEEENGQ